jgi:hypothetical protein
VKVKQTETYDEPLKGILPDKYFGIWNHWIWGLTRTIKGSNGK